MIARLTGTIASKDADSLVVDVGGVGYEVFVPAADFGAATMGQEAVFYIYDHVREDIRALYGFSDLSAKRLFTQLLSVNGIGPKVALAILSAASVDRLQSAIATGDAALLKGVAGVGKKTAERVVVELTGKVTATGVVAAPVSDGAYQALLELGYSSAQAAQALAVVPTEVTGDEARLKAALREVSR